VLGVYLEGFWSWRLGKDCKEASSACFMNVGLFISGFLGRVFNLGICSKLQLSCLGFCLTVGGYISDCLQGGVVALKSPTMMVLGLLSHQFFVSSILVVRSCTKALFFV